MHSNSFVRTSRAGAGAAALVMGLCLSGCGGGSDTPELGYIEGTVTLDDQPLPDARVRFQPTGEAGGRLASGLTDEDGHYVLKYTEDAEGAVPGQYVVRINTGVAAYDDGDEVQPAVPEKVPVQYNRDALDNPEMQKEVKAGENPPIDFALTSEGEIVQPDAPGDPPPGGL